MMPAGKNRPFVALIAQPNEDISGLADAYDEIWLDYFNIPETMKLYPEIAKYNALTVCAITGGIPAIMREYAPKMSGADNLTAMLAPGSDFVRQMPRLLSRYFRRPENYHRILHAIANDNHSVSEIGKFTGFTYNKCDNYLAGLITCGMVKMHKVNSKHGAEKSAYTLTNNYFKLWYKYVFGKQTEIQLGNAELVQSITKHIVTQEIHAFHLQQALKHANKHLRGKLWVSFEISEKLVHTPQTVGEITFDGIVRNGDKAVFVKVFEDPDENCGKAQLEQIRDAVSKITAYYDSHVFVYTKRRFSDYAVAEAANDGSLQLVELERLWG